MKGLQIRAATEADQPAIAEIYNHAVLYGVGTFDTEPRSQDAQRAWFAKHGPRHPVLVATTSSGEVIGWASLSAWSDRKAYDATAEDSVYVHPDAQGKGVGKALMARLLEHADRSGIHVVVARVGGETPASVALHEACGFVSVGVMREVGFKFGRRLNVRVMQRTAGAKVSPSKRAAGRASAPRSPASRRTRTTRGPARRRAPGKRALRSGRRPARRRPRTPR
jgi:L-amino acid N-acyltransferase